MSTPSPAPAVEAAPATVPVTMVPIAAIATHVGTSTALMLPTEVRQLVDQDDAGKWDFAVTRRDLVMRNGEIEFPLDVGGEEPMRERLAPTQYAFGQICSRLGVPAHYLRKCPLVLRDQNLNFWLKEGGITRQPRHELKGEITDSGRFVPGPDDFWDEAGLHAPAFGKPQPQQQQQFQKMVQMPEPADEEKWLLRARHGTLRAALSASYSPMDNAALLDVLLPALPDRYRVQWLGLQDESFHLRLVDASANRAVLPGDDYFAGVHVANSEIGMRSVTVDALVYRLVCTNGLIALVQGKSLLRRRHVHIAAPRFKAALEEALWRAVAATDGLLAGLGRAAKAEVPDPETAIDGFARLWQQNEQTAEIAKAALRGEPAGSQHTVYGVVNAFTHAAQLLPDEKRYELEVLAGQLAQQGDFSLALSKAERAAAKGPRPEPDVAEYARQVFDADVVGRYPSFARAGGAS